MVPMLTGLLAVSSLLIRISSIGRVFIFAATNIINKIYFQVFILSKSFSTKK